MADSIGGALRLTLFGESHGAAVGAVLEGIAPGTPIDEQEIAAAMEKRRAKGAISTARKEPDVVKFLSGVYEGHATGTAITLVIENTNTKSGDYKKTGALLRPGHADYTAKVRYGGFADERGGGHFSGRLTAPLVAAGAICASMLRKKGVLIATRLASCAGVPDAGAWDFSREGLPACVQAVAEKAFPVIDHASGMAMEQAILAAAGQGDSVGGILETVVCGLPAGLGEPFFGSVESTLAALMFSVPAVKGIEFGAGFAFARKKGSEVNDPWQMENGVMTAKTNYNGGINGGITNGMPVVMRTVVKPTPSIYREQDTVDWATGENAKLVIQGRHDPCIAHRAAAVQNAMTAFALADLAAMRFGENWQEAPIWNMG